MAGFMQSSLSDLGQPLGCSGIRANGRCLFDDVVASHGDGVIVAIGFSLAQSKGYFNLEKLAEPKLDNLINPLKGIKD